MHVELYMDGLLLDETETDSASLNEFLEGLEAGRRRFGAMIDAGMSRVEANAEMVSMVAKGMPL